MTGAVNTSLSIVFGDSLASKPTEHVARFLGKRLFPVDDPWELTETDAHEISRCAL